jgi:hypothetical protein
MLDHRDCLGVIAFRLARKSGDHVGAEAEN